MEILGRLSGQRNGSEDISIMLFSKVLLNFAIFLSCFCPILSLTIITGQRNLLSLADGYLTELQRQRKCSNIYFTTKSRNF